MIFDGASLLRVAEWRWPLFFNMAASNMRFGHVQPLDYNFSYDNVLMLEHFRRALYIISFDTHLHLCDENS